MGLLNNKVISVLNKEQDAVGAYIWAWLYYFYDR